MVSAATVGSRYDPASAAEDDVNPEEGGESDPSQPEEVAEVDLPDRGTPSMMGHHRVNFDSDAEVAELSKGIAAAIRNKARKDGIPVGKRTEGPATTIRSVGGVAIPEEHGNSREDVDAYLADRARKSG